MTVPDVTFTPFYPGGWHNLPTETSSLNEDALTHWDATLTSLVARANQSLVLAGVVNSSADGALGVGQHNSVDASGGNRAMTLAAATKPGEACTVEKVDTSANTVTVTGTFRGVSGSIVLSLTKEAVCFVSATDLSWYPFAGHKTLSTLDARYTTSATVGANPTSVLLDRPSGVAEGLTLLAYGESDLAQTTNCSVTFFDRLKNRIGGLYGNYGVGGSLAADICANATGTIAGIRQGAQNNGSLAVSGACTWSPSPYLGTLGGLCIIEPLRNDAGLDGTTTNSGTTAKSRAGATNGLDYMIRLIRCGSKVENNATTTASLGFTNGSNVVTYASAAANMVGMAITAAGVPANSYIGAVTVGVSFTMVTAPGGVTASNFTGSTGSVSATFGFVSYTGTWTTASNTACSGGSISSTTTNGDKVKYVVNLTASTSVAAVLLAIDAAGLGVTGATYSVTVDGGTAIVGTTNDQTRRTGKLSLSFGQMAVDLGSLAAGWHVIVVTHTDTTGRYLYADCTMLESPTPCTLLIDKVRYLTAAGYSTAYPGVGASTSVDDIYNAIVDTVVARWPTDQALPLNLRSIQVLDPNAAGWDPTTMVGNTDGFHIHKNDKGERFYADMYMAVINALQPREGLVKIA